MNEEELIQNELNNLNSVDKKSFLDNYFGEPLSDEEFTGWDADFSNNVKNLTLQDSDIDFFKKKSNPQEISPAPTPQGVDFHKPNLSLLDSELPSTSTSGDVSSVSTSNNLNAQTPILEPVTLESKGVQFPALQNPAEINPLKDPILARELILSSDNRPINDEAKIFEFQEKKDLKIDGDVGPKTTQKVVENLPYIFKPELQDNLIKDNSLLQDYLNPKTENKTEETKIIPTKKELDERFNVISTLDKELKTIQSQASEFVKSSGFEAKSKEISSINTLVTEKKKLYDESPTEENLRSLEFVIKQSEQKWNEYEPLKNEYTKIAQREKEQLDKINPLLDKYKGDSQAYMDFMAKQPKQTTTTGTATTQKVVKQTYRKPTEEESKKIFQELEKKIPTSKNGNQIVREIAQKNKGVDITPILTKYNNLVQAKVQASNTMTELTNTILKGVSVGQRIQNDKLLQPLYNKDAEIINIRTEIKNAKSEKQKKQLYEKLSQRKAVVLANAQKESGKENSDKLLDLFSGKSKFEKNQQNYFQKQNLPKISNENEKILRSLGGGIITSQELEKPSILNRIQTQEQILSKEKNQKKLKLNPQNKATYEIFTDEQHNKLFKTEEDKQGFLRFLNKNPEYWERAKYLNETTFLDKVENFSDSVLGGDGNVKRREEKKEDLRENVLAAYLQQKQSTLRENAYLILKGKELGIDTIPLKEKTLPKIKNFLDFQQTAISEAKNYAKNREAIREENKQNQIKATRDAIDNNFLTAITNNAQALKNGLFDGFNIRGAIATGLNYIGADQKAQDVIEYDNYRNLVTQVPNYIAFQTGNTSTYNGIEYIVDKDNNIVDRENLMPMGDILTEQERNTIIANKSKEEVTEYNTANIFFNTAPLVGQIAAQLIGTKGIGALATRTVGVIGRTATGLETVSGIAGGSKTLQGLATTLDATGKVVGNARLHNAIATSIPIYSTTYTKTYDELVKAGVGSNDAHKYANIVGGTVGTIVGLSAISISPNTEFGKLFNQMEVPRAELIQSIAEFSRRGVLNETTLKAAIKTFGTKVKSLVPVAKESVGEGVQEISELGGQAVAENYVNKEIERDVLEGYNAITKDNLLTSGILGAVGGGSGAVIGNINKPSVNNKTYFGYLQYLNKDKDSTKRILDNLVKGGNVSQENATQLKRDLDELIPNAKKVPTEIWKDLKEKDKLEVVRLFQNKQDLEKKIQEVDPLFHDNIKEQITNIETRLKTLTNGKKDENTNVQGTESQGTNTEAPKVQLETPIQEIPATEVVSTPNLEIDERYEPSFLEVNKGIVNGDINFEDALALEQEKQDSFAEVGLAEKVQKQEYIINRLKQSYGKEPETQVQPEYSARATKIKSDVENNITTYDKSLSNLNNDLQNLLDAGVDENNSAVVDLKNTIQEVNNLKNNTNITQSNQNPTTKIDAEISSLEDKIKSLPNGGFIDIDGEITTSTEYDSLKQKLNNLKQNKDAIQKQSTTQEVLPNGQPEMGLQSVGQGNTQPQETTQQGKEEELKASEQTTSTQSEIDKKADIKMGKVDNTEYEIKTDGVYFEDKKLDNPKNKSHKQLIEADIKRRRDDELESSGENFLLPFILEDPNFERRENSKLLKRKQIQDKINAKYDAELKALEQTTSTTQSETPNETFYTGRDKRYNDLKDLKDTEEEFIFFSKDPKISEWYGGDESNVSETKLDTSNFLDLTTQERKSKFVKENFTDKDIQELYSDEIKYEEDRDVFKKTTRESLIKKYRERAEENRFSGGKEQQFLLKKIKEQGYSGVKLLDTHFGKSDISYVVIDKSKIESKKSVTSSENNTQNDREKSNTQEGNPSNLQDGQGESERTREQDSSDETEGKRKARAGKQKQGKLVKPKKTLIERQLANPVIASALNLEVTDPVSIVMQYFIGGGTVTRHAINKMFARKNRGETINAVGEARAKIQLIAKKGEGKGIDDIAHELLQEYEFGESNKDDFTNAVEEVLLRYNSREAMAKDLLSAAGIDWRNVKEKLTQDQIQELSKKEQEEYELANAQVDFDSQFFENVDENVANLDNYPETMSSLELMNDEELANLNNDLNTFYENNNINEIQYFEDLSNLLNEREDIKQETLNKIEGFIPFNTESTLTEQEYNNILDEEKVKLKEINAKIRDFRLKKVEVEADFEINFENETAPRTDTTTNGGATTGTRGVQDTDKKSNVQSTADNKSSKGKVEVKLRERLVRDEKARNEIDDALEEFRKTFGSLNSGINPETLIKGTKLVALYTKAGIYKFSDIVTDVFAKFGEISQEFFDGIKQSYSAYYSTADDDVADKMDSNLRNVKLEDFKDTQNEGILQGDTTEVSETAQKGSLQGNNGRQRSNGNNRGLSSGKVSKTDGTVEQSTGGRDLFSGDDELLVDDYQHIWSKTKEEFRKSLKVGELSSYFYNDILKYDKNENATITSSVYFIHQFSVEKALREGRNIPLTVLNDYPNLKSIYKANEVAEQKPALVDFNIEENDKKTFNVSQKYKDNIKGLKTLITLIKENRKATAEEKQLLSKYVGFGGLKDILLNPEANESWKESNKAFRPLVKEVIELTTELDALLDAKTLSSIRSSTASAFYTPTSVINSIYKGIEQLGFKGGKILEPSAGNGNFIGFMPNKIKLNSFIAAVELDKITGTILKYIYDDVDVKVSGLEETNIPRNSQDLVISNIPFGNFKVYDKAFKGEKEKFLNRIHNYFFAKSIDTAREGGLIVLLTSKGVLDTKDNAEVRKYIDENTEFLGAVRLPETTFKNNANTKVVTDIVFLKKNTSKYKPKNIDFQKILSTQVPHKDGTTENISVNEYFLNNPQNILGEIIAGGQYSRSDYTVTDKEGKLKDLTKTIQNILPKKIYENTTSEIGLQANDNIEQIESIKEGNIDFVDGKLVKKNNGLIEPLSINEPVQKIKDYIQLRNTLLNLIYSEYKGASDIFLNDLRGKLNTQYDNFVGKYKSLDKSISKIIKQDNDGFNVLSLENNGKKADIFFGRTIEPIQKKNSASNIDEAIVISLYENAYIDIDRIAQLLDIPIIEVLKQAKGKIFENPLGGFETSDEYLYGNVKLKLKQAEESVANGFTEFEYNVEQLTKVIPKDIPALLIEARLGSRWIPSSVYTQFAQELLNDDSLKITYSRTADNYSINKTSYSVEAKNKYGITKRNATDIIIDALHLSPPVIKMPHPTEDKKYIVDKVETAKANEKYEEIRSFFEDWVYKTEERRNLLAGIYNEKYNTTVKRSYDGSHLNIAGINGVELRPHQKDAIWMLLQNNGGIIDHIVGAGKTYIMVAGTMEMRRTGVAKKPMILALKSTIPQIIETYRKSYPMAKISAPTEKDFTKDNRRKLFSQIANNEWDVVIMSHENYGKIPHEIDLQRSFIEDEILELEAERPEIEQEGGRNALKGLETRITNLKARLEKLSDISKDNTLTFQQLGIDHIMVDESQQFKNLNYMTKQRGIAGLSKAEGSRRAFNLFVGIRFLQGKLGGDKGTTFLSGTPISNSMVEMYLLLKYLRPDKMQELGFNSFDGWATTFASPSTEIEFTVTGDFKSKTRFREFINVPELSLLYSEIADVRNDDNLTLDKPKMKSGGYIVDAIPMNEEQIEFGKNLIKFAKEKNGKYIGITLSENQKTAIMLLATNYSSKMAIDMRLINPSSAYNPNGKIAKLVDNVSRIFNESTPNLGTQLVFSDIGTPKNTTSQSALLRDYLEDELGVNTDTLNEIFGDNTQTGYKNPSIQTVIPKIKEVLEIGDEEINGLVIASKESIGSFNIYAEVKKRLIEKGIPENQIVFIHDYKTQKQKDDLFKKVNNGEIRIVLGSTQKLGTGVNAQERIVGMHHLDVPWRPSDMEQRNGRGLRQGNKVAKEYYNNELPIYAYATERTLDTYKYQLLQTKQRFLDQVKSGNLDGERVIKEADGDAESGVGYAQLVAMLSGNQDILVKSKLEQQLDKLKKSKRNFDADKYDAESKIKKIETNIPIIKENIERTKIDIEEIKKFEIIENDEVIILFNDKKYEKKVKKEGKEVKEFDKKKLGEEVVSAIDTKMLSTENNKMVNIGKINNISILGENIIDRGGQKVVRLSLSVNNNLYGFNYSQVGGILLNNFINGLERIPKLLEVQQITLEKAKKDLVAYQELLKAEWNKQEDLDKIQKELKEVNKRLEESEKTEENTDFSKSEDVKFQLDSEKNTISFATTQDTKPFATSDSTPATKENLQAKFKDATVVQSESELPTAIQNEIRQQKAQGKVKGVFYDGKVYLVADNIRTIGEATGTYRHEKIGHQAVMDYLGNKLNEYASRIIDNANGPKLKKLQELAARYGMPTDLSKLTPSQKVKLGEEYIAMISENLSKYPKAWNDLVSFVRETLRKFGIKLNVSDTEIQSLIGKAEKRQNDNNKNLDINNSNTNFVEDEKTKYTKTSTGETIPFKVFSPTQRTPSRSNILWENQNSGESNDYALVERKFVKYKQLSFTSGTKINNHNDIAWLFRSLEDEAVEHSFALYTLKDGSYFVQHLGTGGIAATVVDGRLIVGNAIKMNADFVTFIHNHPSGTLKTSNADIQVYKNLKKSLSETGIKLNDGIIINLKSGKYVVFDEYSETIDVITEQNQEQKKVKIYSFSKQVFAENYNPIKINGSSDIAKFLTTKKFGISDKTEILITNNQLEIIGKFILPEKNQYNKIVELLTQYGGVQAILYGNKINANTINNYNERLKSIGFNIVDGILVKSDNYKSLADLGLINEDKKQPNNSQFQINTPQAEIDAIKEKAVADGTFMKVAFSPNQIKSATDNVGTFDENNNDIRFQTKTPLEIVSQLSNEELIDFLLENNVIRKVKCA